MKDKILQLIQDKGPLRPALLVRELEISAQALHRHLKKLVLSGLLIRKGVPPRVFYDLAINKTKKYSFKELDSELVSFLEKHYTYGAPDGRIIAGVKGFQEWTISIGEVKAFESLAKAFLRIRKETFEMFDNELYVSAQKKFQDTFSKCFMDNVWYGDFYSLPQFGKTLPGHLLTQGKSSQSISAIRDLARLSKEAIQDILKRNIIEAIVWTPHSIPRKVVFLSEFRHFLNLNQPQIKAVKAYTGGIPIAQKSLKKLTERIENARNTLFINETNLAYKNVLIIDDAVGSGATMNELASKLKNQFKVQKVFGFAIVGSFKGFDVISEI